jgi:ribonuclease P protein component
MGENPIVPEMSKQLKSQAFPKSNRLLKRREFLRVYEGGTRHTDRLIWIYVLETNQAESARVGITIPRKVGKAVRRNKLRRRIREIWRRLQHRLKPGMDIVINCGTQTAKLNFSQLQTRLENLLTTAGLLTDGIDRQHSQSD